MESKHLPTQSRKRGRPRIMDKPPKVKRPMGRPPLMGEARTAKIDLYFTPAQRELIRNAGGTADVLARFILARLDEINPQLMADGEGPTNYQAMQAYFPGEEADRDTKKRT